MRRPWEKFGVVSNQVEVEYVDVVHRSRGALVFELGTVQKYPEVLSYGGTEMLLMTSERTPPSQRNSSQEATAVIFPRSVRGWDVVAPHQGRYSLTVALYKPIRRRGRDKMTARTEAWRIKEIIGRWK